MVDGNLFIILSLVNYFLMLIMILIGVAFLTLMERKVLGYMQLRKGPNKLGIMGLLQPFSDAIKLFSKEVFFIYKSNYFYYYLSPILSIMLAMMFWLFYPFFYNFVNFNYSLLLMFCLFSLGPYSMMLGGWSSNSNYSMLGSLRSVAQSISYEVCMILIMFSIIILVESFKFLNVLLFQKFIMFMILLFPLYLIFFISILAELNRTPFDLIEGESELVSGFNVEYFSGMFIFYFLAEYMMIIFMSMIMVIMFMGLLGYSFLFMIFMIIYNYLIIWIRGILPRIRYDELMYLCWKKSLPISLMYLFFVFGLKLLMMIFN